MERITFFIDTFLFRLSTLNWADALDLFLVALTFFLVFQLVRRSQAASILRGVMILGALLLAFTLLLPLPTFSSVVQVMALASLIVIPVILQPELRRWLERLGRNRGLFGSTRISQSEANVRALVKAAEEMSANGQGALIAVEGRDSLQAYVDGGVSIDGQLTAELLQSIFYGENPLHDGAVVVREAEVAAAGCVLPLTEELPVMRRRLGTRHRAAVGVTEVSDALSIIVSEETGAISAARFGQLHYAVDSTNLRQHILDFYADEAAGTGRRLWSDLWSRPDEERGPTFRAALSQLGYLLLSILLAFALWGAIAAQQNPIRQITVPGVPLTVTNRPADWLITSPVPDTVRVEVQTDELTVDTISPRSFQATVDLSGATLGLQRVPVVVTGSTENVRILTVDPAQLDMTLSASETITVPVTVNVTDPDSIPPSYQLVGKPQSTPASVEVDGPADLVDRVDRVEVTLTLNGTTSSVRTLLPVTPVDEAGAVVTGVVVEPSQVLVTAAIRRQTNVQDVGVRVVTEGAPPTGYWVSTIAVDPASVTLRGAPADLEAIGSFVTVAPIDISQVQGVFTTSAPLQLPPAVSALDGDGRVISSVQVTIETTPLLGELVLTRIVAVQGVAADTAVTVEPAQVQLLISGPVPTLNDIELNPDLVQVFVAAGDLRPGESVTLVPQVVAPSDTIIQLIEQSVIVTRGP
jgi:diadenylate cyclase